MARLTVTRWMRTGACAALLGLLLLAAPRPALAYSYYNPIPQGTILTSRPEIGIQLLPGQGDRLTVQVLLDGHVHTVPVAADGSAFYVPPAPLAPGPHIAIVTVNGAEGGQVYAPVAQTLHFTVAAQAVPLPAISLTDLQALAQLDRARQSVGLAPVAFSPQLQAATAAHARYVVDNADLYQGASMHSEPSREAPGYSGDTAGARDAAFGSFGNVEVMATHCPAAAGSTEITGLMDTVFHRLGLLDPAVDAGGADTQPSNCDIADPNPFVMDLQSGFATAAKPVIYPASGQQGVPLSFSYEVPNPLPAGAPAIAGYPITAGFPGRGSTKLATAALTTASGHAVPIYKLDSSWQDRDPVYSGDTMGNAIAVIPQAPLQAATTYTVHVTGTETPATGTSRPFDLTWSFQTTPMSFQTVWRQGGGYFATGSFGCPASAPDGTWLDTIYCSPGLLYLRNDYGLHTANSAPPFADAARDSWATTAINLAYGLGWANGTAPGAFSPDAALTQAEALTLLARSQGARITGGTWAAAALAWAQAHGVIVAGDDYAGGEPASRAEFTTWIARAWHVPLQAGAAPTFADAAAIPAGDAPAIAWAQAAGLVKGTGDNRFAPQGTLTRAEAVTILARMVLPPGK